LLRHFVWGRVKFSPSLERNGVSRKRLAIPIPAWHGLAMTLGPKNKKPVGKAEKPARGPRRITPSYLENAGLFYLERYASSVANFRRVLMNKVRRSASFHGTEISEGEKLVDDLIVRYRRSGLLDDRRYAETKVVRFHRHGMAVRGIQAKLWEKGVPKDVIAAALEGLCEDGANPDLAAAATYVRRRRLGPYRAEAVRGDYFDRDLAALGRAGFSYELAKKMLQAESVAALKELSER